MNPSGPYQNLSHFQHWKLHGSKNSYDLVHGLSKAEVTGTKTEYGVRSNQSALLLDFTKVSRGLKEISKRERASAGQAACSLHKRVQQKT